MTVAPFAPPVVHTPVVWLAKETARFDDAVALNVTVLVGLKVWFVGVPKVIVWLALATVNDWVTDDAALYVLLPPWDAVMVHVPAARRVAVEPLTVQIPVVLLEKLTARPDDALAERVKEVSKVRVPGLLKVIVWLRLAVAPPHELEMRVHEEPVVEER